MEHSVNYPARRKAYSNHQRTIYEEEEEEEEDRRGVEVSSWTMYFEEDHGDENEAENEEGSFCYDDSSMISDAASPAAKRIGRRSCCDGAATGKRRRIIRQVRDEEETKQEDASLVCGDLEDTASSPSNSPKICNMLDEMDNDTTQPSARDKTKEKEGITEARSTIKGMTHEELSMELKKRGLCLVPLSMLSIYLD